MLDIRTARYSWGLLVQAAQDLLNDGSHPAAADGSLLVSAGTRGEIVNIGHHPEANLPVYLVDFGGALVGVLEEEILPAGTLAMG
jgi:nitrogen fixation protein NifZ